MSDNLYAQPPNQAPPFEDVNLYATDRALREAVAREGGGGAAEWLAKAGARAGGREALELARLANDNPPTLRLFDASGRRLDQVEFHPAYHRLMGMSAAEGLHCSVWAHLKDGGAPKPSRNVERAAAFYMAAQMEAGHCCPITMTNAAIAVLRHGEPHPKLWLSRLLAYDYDPAFQPVPAKRAATVGMGMTEKQGGTDVRTNTTRAEPAGQGEYLVSGEKWFMSAPMSDAFLVLAQAPKGLSCFFMPRFLPDGSQNAILIQRLKEKLGNRSNASSEVVFDRAHAWLLGEEGRGISTIIEMVTATRLDCAISSAGLMRWALALALHHCRHRVVFGRTLIEQPLMRAVLADMALDHEATTALVFRLARAFDRAEGDEAEAAFARLMTPAIKYWVCKTLPAFAYEAMECLGGNGYVEEGGIARLFRESPINAIWEGSGNVMCLDVLRVARRSPEAVAALFDTLAAEAAGDPILRPAVDDLREAFADPDLEESALRHLVERLVHVVAASLLRAHAPASVADAYLANRLAGCPGRNYGTLEKADFSAILARAAPDP